jgi:hypothetical protein
MLPAKSSTKAVQLSTQSPQFRYSMFPIFFVSARWMWPQITPHTFCFRAICTIVSSYSVMYFTADFAFDFRYAATDQ